MDIINTQHQPSGLENKLHKVITEYNDAFKTFTKRSKVFQDKFLNNDVDDENRKDFNILWSNIETVRPALFASLPKVNIKNRNNTKDALNLAVANVLEQATAYYMDEGGLKDCIKPAIQDYGVVGRGTVWTRYEALFQNKKFPIQKHNENETENLNHEASESENYEKTETENENQEEVELLEKEMIHFDFVYWQDFGHNVTHDWKYVHKVWRIIPMDKEYAKDFFKDKDIFKKISFSNAKTEQDTPQKQTDDSKDARIYEIWCKYAKKIYYYQYDTKVLLKTIDVQIELTGFFPCPKPLFATMNTNSLIPAPDFMFYQDLVELMDTIKVKISQLLTNIKLTGVCDVLAEGANLKQLLQLENGTMQEIKNYAMVSEKGGINALFSILDFTPSVNALQVLNGQIEIIKNEIYEICGIADLMRGKNDALSSATSEEIKDKWGTLRMTDKQDVVSEFIKSIVVLTAEMICGFADPQTIADIVHVDNVISDEAYNEYMQAQQQAQMQAQQQAQMQAQNPNMPPQPQPKPPADNISYVSVGMVFDAMKNIKHIKHIINIETDSTIKTNQAQEKAEKLEFLTSFAPMLDKGIMIAQQGNLELTKLFAEMLKFAVSSFKSAQILEQQINDFLEQAKKITPPDPKAQQAEIQAQEQAKAQMLHQFEMELQNIKNQHEKMLNDAKLQNDAMIAQAKLQNDIKIEEMRGVVRLNDTGRGTYGQNI